MYFRTIDERTLYTNRNFHVSIFDSEEYASNNRSLLGKLRNNLVNALNKCHSIPKIIVVTLEDAIINDMGVANFGVTFDMEIRVKWLTSQYRKIVEAFLDFLPAKNRRDNWPKFIFICPSSHINYRNNALCKKFCRVLEDSCASTERMTAMRLRNGWDFDDRSIYMEPQQRFTTEGLAMFWHAVDKVIEEYDMFMFNVADGPIETSQRNLDFNQRNEFSWQSPAYSQNRRARGRNWRGGARF